MGASHGKHFVTPLPDPTFLTYSRFDGVRREIKAYNLLVEATKAPSAGLI